MASSRARIVRDADRRMLAGVTAALAQVALGVTLIVAGVTVFLVSAPSVSHREPASSPWPRSPWA